MRDEKWLSLCDGTAGMYPGIQQDRIPTSVSHRLYTQGLITAYVPRNFDHKERWVITDAGRRALSFGIESK